ncbi:MAG: ABC transporter permease [Chloroflexi bacterium]|nr:ABC transporter permease [Chloroflexota bacterium]
MAHPAAAEGTHFPSRLLHTLRGLISAPFPLIGTLAFLGFLLLAIFGHQIAPYAFDDQDFDARQPPDCALRVLNPFQQGCDHPFGTDNLGQDVYSRVILGTQEVFRLAGLGTLLAVIIGTTIGLVIGYEGGLLDEVVARLLDSFLAMPALLLALVLLGSLGDAENSLFLVLIIVYAPIVARVVRSNVLEIKTRGFVEAAQLRGETRFYILFREILPSVIPALVVEASLRFSYGIFLVASLGFLGIGAHPPTPNWGLMVSDARTWYSIAPWMLEYPAGAIVTLVIAVNLMSDGIRKLVQRSN